MRSVLIFSIFTFLLLVAFSSLEAQAYSESFESGFGNWMNVNDDDGLTWSRNTTPGSSADGSHYLYINGDQNGGKVVALESSCYFQLNGNNSFNISIFSNQ